MTVKGTLDRMESGISSSLLEQLPGHPSARAFMRRLEAWERSAEKTTIAEAAAKEEAKDRQIAGRIRARRGELPGEVHGSENNDAQAMERGESKANVRWAPSPKRPREQYRAMMNTGYCEKESVPHNLLRSTASSKSSCRPMQSFPKVARPVAPILNQQPSGMSLFPRHSETNPETPVFSALHPSLCSPVPSPILEVPAEDP
ncbi:MAG: hypothetical protein Q9157_002471, partial [Trypethelium eluteriae]